MIEYIFLIVLFFILWWLLVKSFDWVDERHDVGLFDHVDLDKPNYGIFYNPNIKDERKFDLGDKVWFFGGKYYVVGMRYKPTLGIATLELSFKTHYNVNAITVDSREVKKVVRID